MPAPAMTVAALETFLTREFPQVFTPEGGYVVEMADGETATIRCRYHEKHLRPGGTMSGPTMMTLADVALYVAILARIGPVALAVTTNLTINFLRKPEAGDLVARCRLLKLGKRLAVGEVEIYSDGDADMVAHVIGTYSIPPR